MEKLSSILLIDDDKTTNFLNRLLLEDLQVAHQVLVAENGQQALHIMTQGQQQSRPALILLDVNMPVMNGFEFLEAYATLEEAYRQSIILVMLTTSLHPRDIARLQELPIQGFLSKPLTKQMVQELLQTHFQRVLPD
ncbi:response regulator [Hymenobacter taeanensis]|uniref:Response regulator n=1 Tax=Hymenobacter taeanensis TaxID=2735321 RepID=A0A6M6BMP0_9BACT|nr:MULTISPECIES: response regulator [Hymenobacter]QJX48723.1 response regulator [Hymenobacter taeanensis]UOQ81776.1 response regulator [Hymenobacter sp. 5414T-23]